MLIVTGLPNVILPVTFAFAVKYANATPTPIDVNSNIERTIMAIVEPDKRFLELSFVL